MQLLEFPRALLHKVQKFPVLFGLNFVETCEHKASVGLADHCDSLDQATIDQCVKCSSKYVQWLRHEIGL